MQVNYFSKPRKKPFFNKLFFAIIFFQCLGIFCNADELQNELGINTNTHKKINTELELIFKIEYPVNAILSAEEKINFLTKKNKSYLQLGFLGEITPSTLSGGINLNSNYLKFIHFFSSIKLGSGWNYPSLKFYGLTGNHNFYGKEIKILYNFNRLYLKTNTGIKLFLNLNYFIKNEWSNLEFSSVQSFPYQGIFPQLKNEFWYYKNDNGENRNGFLYKANYSLKYTMPLYLNAIGINFCTIKKLYKPIPYTENIGEKLWSFMLSNFIIFKPVDSVQIKLSSVFATAKNYINYNPQLHFTEKTLNYNYPQYLYFKRISMSIIWNIKSY